MSFAWKGSIGPPVRKASKILESKAGNFPYGIVISSLPPFSNLWKMEFVFKKEKGKKRIPNQSAFEQRRSRKRRVVSRFFEWNLKKERKEKRKEREKERKKKSFKGNGWKMGKVDGAVSVVESKRVEISRENTAFGFLRWNQTNPPIRSFPILSESFNRHWLCPLGKFDGGKFARNSD